MNVNAFIILNGIIEDKQVQTDLVPDQKELLKIMRQLKEAKKYKVVNLVIQLYESKIRGKLVYIMVVKGRIHIEVGAVIQ